jgi:hypothetical protein
MSKPKKVIAIGMSAKAEIFFSTGSKIYYGNLTDRASLNALK